MDGVVIYVAKDRSRAIIWCSDHGPLGLARKDAMPRNATITVGDFVQFDATDDGDMRLCGRLTPVPGASMAGLPDLLRGEAQARRRRAHLSVVPKVAPPAKEFATDRHCG
ncbi:hypothetical protein SAMN05421774_101899 [Gemmobacter megaterium]|uniref:Cold shock protein, CspA family n=1 Tax=Gemmobacter megaterium TaxID=1086013 RepID=A0A1N7L497_9RHOB|nr:hypothetical protein [Gemmobacter megaterium]GGE05527.1 hypothetical protein GCM10011345_08850 [Gemmobacter megaterium]SIS68644.1 hypothetical protein SAMN05421774_101899 [Gemmobacter megaterium]